MMITAADRELGARFKTWRENNGLSQQSAAGRLGCSPALISRLEKGHLPKAATLSQVKRLIADTQAAPRASGAICKTTLAVALETHLVPLLARAAETAGVPPRTLVTQLIVEHILAWATEHSVAVPPPIVRPH